MNKIWTDEVTDMLRAHIEGGLSYGRAADALNSRFNLAITRRAAIGRGYRIGLVPPKREKVPKIPKPPKRSTANHDITLVRMVRGKGNSNNLRVTTSREAVEQYKLRCVEVVTRDLTFAEIEPGDGLCRYPKGDEVITYCGHPVREGSSFCVPHHHICFVPPKPRHDVAMRRNAA